MVKVEDGEGNSKRISKTSNKPEMIQENEYNEEVPEDEEPTDGSEQVAVQAQ
jgi:hypothetical protein